MDGVESFVEGRITAISVSDDGKTINITILFLGARYVLTLEGVDRFTANEFRQQNVIESINMWTRESDQSSLRSLLGSLIAGTVDPVALEPFSSAIREEMDAISEGKKVFLEIQAIYGASVMALASTCVFRKL